MRASLHGTEPLTRWELMDALQRRGFTLERKSQAPIHLIRIAALKGHVCLGPYRDNGEPTYVLLGEWLPADSGASKPRLDRLLARYLEGYGPASLKDFAAWSGIPVTLARQAWDPGAFKEIEVGGSKLWADEIAIPVAGNRVVRLLPAFDSYVLGYRDRDLVVASERRGDVYHGGQVAPTLIVDGAVAGVWRYERKGKKLLVEISSFKPLASPIRRVIKEEAEDVARFLGFSLSRESPLIRISR
jgi:hypothetical protein